MALLSLAAVYLLWETLKAGRKTLSATQEMATDARAIGEAQVQAHLMPKEAKATAMTSQSDGYWSQSFFIRFSGVNVGNTPAYRVSVKAIVDGVEPSDGWTPVSPRDVGPNEEFSIKYMSDEHAISSTDVAPHYRLSVYIKFDTIFTRGNATKAKQIRFDYRIGTDRNGVNPLERI